ncbi:M20 family metallopeptidase (plasmid) [Mesorhizobium sp. ORM8.1]
MDHGHRDKRILDAVEQSRDALLGAVSEAVRIPSVTGTEGPAAMFFADVLKGLGADCQLDRVTDAFMRQNTSCSSETDLGNRPNVYGWFRAAGSISPPIVLNGHVDVVPPGDAHLWTHPPFSGDRENGVIWGRGSADMKGGLLCGIFAAKALQTAGIPLSRDIQVQCVVGEESTGIGTRYALASQPRPAAAIVLEPTENNVVSTCGGSMHFEIQAFGRAAHTSVSWTGQSAMENLWRLYHELKGWAVSKRNPVTLPKGIRWPRHDPFAIGRFEAGEWLATLPETARMFGRIGVHPSQTIQSVKTGFEEALAEICANEASLKDKPAKVRWLDEGLASWSTPVGDDLVQAFILANASVGQSAEPHGATYGSDAGTFALAGIPTVLFGPGRIVDAHIVDEHVSEEALIDATRTIALALSRLAAPDQAA